MDSKIINCNNDIIKNVREEIFSRFYKPIYIPLLSLLTCFIFFISKESKKFSFYRSIIFLIGILVIVISEVSLTYSVNSNFGMYSFKSNIIVNFNFIYSYIKKNQKY